MIEKMFSLVFILCFFFIPIFSSEDNNVNGLFDTKITIDWNKVYQRVEGFGAFASADDTLMKHSKKEEILEALFGKSGLQLQVLRSTIFPSYNKSEFEKSPEVWMQKEAKKFGVSRLISSAWSPPYDWKSRKGNRTGENFNYLKEVYYPDFANYIADFVELHDKLGLKLYAVSPQNEPEFPTTHWDGCVWFPSQTAKFVRYHLRPTLNNRTLSTKIIIGENANWNFAGVYLSITSAMIRENDFDIYASHGYSLPNLSDDSVTYNQHVFPWISPFFYNKERWITEASATDQYDSSMTKGVLLATSLTKFLTTGNVNGYIFWQSFVSGQSNEGLIVGNHTDDFTLPRVYHVYGHFTRFIKVGDVRVHASKSLFSSSDIEVVAFKNEATKSLAIVLTNSGSSSRFCQITFKNIAIESKRLSAVLTNDKDIWAKVEYPMKSVDTISINVPPLSVITLTHTLTGAKK